MVHRSHTVFATLALIIGLISSVPAGLTPENENGAEAPAVRMARGNASRTAEMPGPGPANTPVEQWRFVPHVDRARLFPPVVADGLLYTIDTRLWSNALYALNVTTGVESWRYPAEPAEVIVGAPAVAEGLVVLPIQILDDRPYLAALESTTGEEQWRVPLDIAFVGFPSPAVVDGVVYIGMGAEQVTALDLADGRTRWRASVGAQVATDVAVADGTVYVATDEPSIVALNVSDGSERWRVGFAADEILLTPVVSEGLVLALAFPHPTVRPEGKLHALDTDSGAERWRSADDYGVFLEPAVAAGTVYVHAELTEGMTRVFVALDIKTGRQRWRLSGRQFLISPPSVAGDTVYAGSADGILAMDATSGTPRWEVRVPTVTTVPVVVDGVVYGAGPEGLVALAESA